MTQEDSETTTCPTLGTTLLPNLLVISKTTLYLLMDLGSVVRLLDTPRSKLVLEQKRLACSVGNN